MDGLVIRSMGGFYNVLCGNEILDCKPRGIFRKEKTVIVVGDKVEAEKLTESTGVITKLKERANLFARPPIANLDKMFIVISAAFPAPDTLFADKLTVICENNKVEPIIVFNKSDLADVTDLETAYSKAGYKTLLVSATENKGIDKLYDLAKGCICGFAGFSGVGKSSIISNLTNLAIETGSVSARLGRGKHTTRHVELFPLSENTLIADTPGFSSLDIMQTSIKKEALPYLFHEFEEYIGDCKFTTCSHTKEKGCAICQAVESGKIAKSRHESYISLYEQLKQRPSWE